MHHIFTGPSTALGEASRSTCPPNAILHQMTTVDPTHIAYGCLQVFLFFMQSEQTLTTLSRLGMQSHHEASGQKLMAHSITASSTTTWWT